VDAPPVADAGPDQTVPAAANSCGASVTLDGTGSSDPDGDALAYTWSEGGRSLGTGEQVSVWLPVGIHSITLTVDDGHGATTSASTTVQVVDTTPPVITLQGSNPAKVECHGSYTDPGALANDACAGDLSSAIQVSGVVNPNVPGAYILTYTVTDPAGNTATATRTVNVIAAAPGLTAISPNSTAAGTASLELTVNGTCFVPGSVVLWNGQGKPTTFVSDGELKAQLAATDLTTTESLRMAAVTVLNPIAPDQFSSGGESSPAVFTIFGNTVGAVENGVAESGTTVQVSTLPSAPDQCGVSAQVSNGGSPDPILVSTATYTENPTSGTLFTAGGGFVDLQITGADASDTAVAQFYYPSTLTGATELVLQLIYFNGTTWAPVLSSGGVAPVKDTTDNLDGTVSGGRFTVTYDNTSTPKITELSGTVFAVFLPDTTPPTVSCPSITLPCSVDALVTVNYPAPTTLSDNVDQPSQITLNYSIPSGSGFKAGATTVTCTATDRSGNGASTTFTVTRAALGFSGFLSPIGGADASGGSYAHPLGTFKLGSTVPVKFTASCGGAPVLTGIHRLQATKYSNTTTSDPPIDAVPQGGKTAGNQFVLTDGEWHFNLDTKATGMSPGIWLLTATLSDGSQHSVWTQLK
jgi:hypothetical protein